MNYIKNCSNCGGIQTYTTKSRLESSIRENWVCNNCSSVHAKKIYSDDIVNNIVKLYEDGNSFSKISSMVNIRRDNVKKILMDKNVWVEKRDNIKKDFSSDDVDNIVKKYGEGLSLQKISDLYGVSKSPIKRILKAKNLLRDGYSDGKKIELSNDQMTNIRDFYLNDFKNSNEIANQLGLKKSFIDKYLTNCGYRRNRSEATSLAKIGKKLSESIKDNMKNAQQKLAKSGKRKQTGGVCKHYIINGLECQGTYEKFYLEKLIENNEILPKNSIPIETPYGVYYPDFTYENRLVEIKSDYTYDVLLGIKESRFTKQKSLRQFEKIKWVNSNVKEVDILVVDKRNNKITKKEII